MTLVLYVLHSECACLPAFVFYFLTPVKGGCSFTHQLVKAARSWSLPKVLNKYAGTAIPVIKARSPKTIRGKKHKSMLNMDMNNGLELWTENLQ